MGKHEKGTPKEIANRCKSKGLQKLRWFCQMCQKQCRDQNGFKCHLMSEAHQRQLLLFAESPHVYLKEYSKEFQKGFLLVLKNTFGTKRVRANEVYQEYIRDKLHVHMNSTTWHTLTNFVNYLGSEGICRVDLTEKGWFIALIDQEEEMRKAEAAQKVKANYDDEQHHQQLLAERAERARQLAQDSTKSESKPTELMRSSEDEKVVFSLSTTNSTNEESAAPSLTSAGKLPVPSLFEAKSKSKKVVEDDKKDRLKNEAAGTSKSSDRNHEKSSKYDRQDHYKNEKRNHRFNDDRVRSREPDSKKPRSALDEIRAMEEWKKERKNRKDYWLHEGIIVKVITKKLGDEFYKAKGVVKSLVDEYTAHIDVDGALLKVDQQHVETVIPALGRAMLVVNGAYRDTKAILESVNEDDFTISLRLDEGFAKGRLITVPYEDASKLAQ